MNKPIDRKLFDMFIDSVTETIFASDLSPEKQADILGKIESRYSAKIDMEVEKIKHSPFTYEK